MTIIKDKCAMEWLDTSTLSQGTINTWYLDTTSAENFKMRHELILLVFEKQSLDRLDGNQEKFHRFMDIKRRGVEVIYNYLKHMEQNPVVGGE
jgi:hypothetical protein